jgi:hypothetical protein
MHYIAANLFSRERNLNTAIKESDLPLVGTQHRSREVPDFVVELVKKFTEPSKGQKMCFVICS